VPRKVSQYLLRFGGIGGHSDFPVKGTVRLGAVVGLTDDTEMLSTRLEALPTAFCVTRKDEFLISPVAFSSGDTVLSIDTCMLPLNDEF
jgi:hypothetical protein